MPSQKKQSQKTADGFTIIEVVLVLAIAGLIFLMVFVALPALQRSQRDTQRRNDISRVDTSLMQYQTNHTSGANITSLPKAGSWLGAATFSNDCASNSACTFVREYMNTGSGEATKNVFTDPDGTPYSLVITGNWSEPSNVKTVSFTGANNKAVKLTVTNARGTITESTAYDAHTIFIIPGATCDGADAVPATQRHFAIMYRLEGAGVYCMDDQ